MNIQMSPDLLTQQAYSQPVKTVAQNQAEAKKVSDDFESFFVFQMLELMEPDMSDNDVFGGGLGEEMFASVRNEHVADAITANGGIGLSDTIYNHLLSLQEVK